MKKIIIVNAVKYAEILATVELVLERSFQGASITTLAQAVRARLGELEVAAKSAALFNNDALEIGVLRELLQNLGLLAGFQDPS
ncbi:MAG: hypothetical protein ACOYNZ_02375 [Rhodoferax sp.]